MRRDERWEIAAEFVRPAEAEMLRELLESAGIPAAVENAHVAGLGLFPPALVSARVLVPAGDAARAREIVASSGVVRGPAAGEGGDEEIPESEWAAPPRPEGDDAGRDDGVEGVAGHGARRIAAVIAGAILLGALAWLALARARGPELPDPPWRTAPASRRSFP